MIDDKKLLCAFIYSAYDSGYCGLELNRKEKQHYMEFYKKFIKTTGYFPDKEIRKTQSKMIGIIDNTNIRDYVYHGHIDIVKTRISKATKKDFSSSIKSAGSLFPAISCPVAFYEVTKTTDHGISGRNLFLPKLERDLTILDGLEHPKIGDIVSGHWDYFLENITEWKELDKYKKIYKNYVDILKNAHK